MPTALANFAARDQKFFKIFVAFSNSFVTFAHSFNGKEDYFCDDNLQSADLIGCDNA